MNEEFYTTKEVSQILEKSVSTIHKRMSQLNIKKRFDKQHNLILSKEELESVKNIPRQHKYSLKKYSRSKVFIIEYFISHHINTHTEIASVLGIQEHIVCNTINEYLENNNQIVVESSMNLE